MWEDLAVVLWYAIRHVQDWANTSGPRRPMLFVKTATFLQQSRAQARALAPELARAIRVFERLTHDPLSLTGNQVARACQSVAEWAYERGFTETAIQFAEAAAAAEPLNPHWANLAGRMNRTAGEWTRAHIWYERGIGLARRRNSLKDYCWAHRGLGVLYHDKGDFRRARKHFATSAWAAREAGQKWLAAQTQHDLLLMAAERGEYVQAEEHARKALAWYPKHNERFPALVHDFAFLLVRLHLYSAALPLLEWVMKSPIPAPDQVIGWSTLARCAASVGDASLYEAAKLKVLALAPLHGLHAAAAMVNLAFGARALKAWEQAEIYARNGIETAKSRGDTEVARVGEELLREIVSRTAPATEAPPRAGEAAKDLQILTEEFRIRLTRWRGPTWRHIHQAGPRDVKPV